MPCRRASREGAGPEARSPGRASPLPAGSGFKEETMSALQSKRIVVGVDGSPSSVHALEWAIHQAELTGDVIDAVNAWHFPNDYGMPVGDLPDFAGLGAEILDKAIAEARNATGQAAAEIHPHVVEGNPAQALLDLAKGADLLVVGSRGHGRGHPAP